jgi:hypothetical protein
MSKPTLKITLGEERRKLIEELAKESNRSLSETINLLLDVILDNYDKVREMAEIERRTFLDMVRLWLEDGEAGKAAAEFLRALAKRERPTNSTCIKLAHALGCDSDRILAIRDCALEKGKQPDGKGGK